MATVLNDLDAAHAVNAELISIVDELADERRRLIAERDAARADRDFYVQPAINFGTIRALLKGEWWLRHIDTDATIDIDSDGRFFARRTRDGMSKSFDTLAEAVEYVDPEGKTQ